MQIYICDDDELDTMRLSRMIACYAKRFDCAPDLRAFSDPTQLLAALQNGYARPDLLFLDIYMAGMDGVQVLEQLRRLYERPVPVIFSTSSRAHAIDAFRLRAVGYLLKPYTQEEFNHALVRVERLFVLNGRSIEIMVPEQETRQKVCLGDVYYIESDGRKSLLHIAAESPRKDACGRPRTAGEMTVNVRAVNSKITMQEYRKRLEGEKDFFECGRSYLVNLNHAASLNGNALRMEDGDIIPVPERVRQSVAERMEEWKQHGGNLYL